MVTYLLCVCSIHHQSVKNEAHYGTLFIHTTPSFVYYLHSAAFRSEEEEDNRHETYFIAFAFIYHYFVLDALSHNSPNVYTTL